MTTITPYAPMLDYYGDPTTHAKGYTLGGLYYYILDEYMISQMTTKNFFPIPPISAIVSVNYMPYLDSSNIIGGDIPFDLERFKLTHVPNDPTKPIKVWRITDFANMDITVGTTSKYKLTGSYQTGGTFSWEKESKLWNYPYTFTEINDTVSTPLQLFPHLLNSSNITVKVKTALNQNGMYIMYVPNYKGDTTGLTEGVVTSGLSLPIMSSAYTDYMVANQHSLRTERTFGLIGTVSTAITNAVTGNIGGAVNTAISGLGEINKAISMEQDLKNTPNTLRSTGGDVLFNMQINNKKLYAYRYQYPIEIMQRLGTYFHMFGYKQNQLMTVNFKNRYFYNYIKTIQCNLKAIGDISKEQMEEMKGIFNGGVTIWHITNNNVTVGDYSKDNYEV